MFFANYPQQEQKYTRILFTVYGDHFETLPSFNPLSTDGSTQNITGFTQIQDLYH